MQQRTSGQLDAPLAHEGLVGLWQSFDGVMDVCKLGRRRHLLNRRLKLPEANVSADIKERRRVEAVVLASCVKTARER